MHTTDNYNSPYVNGFNQSDFLLDPYTYDYLNSSYQRNQDPPVSYEGQHTADVLAEKVFGFLHDALEAKHPFFLGVAPVSPHSDVIVKDPYDFLAVATVGPPIPLSRHSHLFQNVKVPRTKNFNPDKVCYSQLERPF
jgi:hypothetical protein